MKSYSIDSSFWINILENGNCVVPKEVLNELKNTRVKEFVEKFCRAVDVSPRHEVVVDILHDEIKKYTKEDIPRDLKSIELRWNAERFRNPDMPSFQKRKLNAEIDSKVIGAGDVIITMDRNLYKSCKKNPNTVCIFVPPIK